MLVREIPGHVDDAAPLEVQVSGEGVGIGATEGVTATDGLADGVTCAVPPPDEPHAANTITAATTAPIFTT
ncbi:MAG: hypothetical protein ACHQ0J_11750 [Candidatus Dormibacterales bacterium]